MKLGPKGTAYVDSLTTLVEALRTRLTTSEESRKTAEAILNTCVVLAVNEAYSDQDLDDTVKAFERVVGYFQSKR